MVRCPQCGSNEPDQAKFCRSCGTNLTTAYAQQPQYAPQNQQPECLWCHQRAGFKVEEGKLDSKFGFTAHRVKMYICNNCGYVHSFGLGRTIFDFD